MSGAWRVSRVNGRIHFFLDRDPVSACGLSSTEITDALAEGTKPPVGSKVCVGCSGIWSAHHHGTRLDSMELERSERRAAVEGLPCPMRHELIAEFITWARTTRVPEYLAHRPVEHLQRFAAWVEGRDLALLTRSEIVEHLRAGDQRVHEQRRRTVASFLVFLVSTGRLARSPLSSRTRTNRRTA